MNIFYYDYELSYNYQCLFFFFLHITKDYKEND